MCWVGPGGDEDGGAGAFHAGVVEGEILGATGAGSFHVGEFKGAAVGACSIGGVGRTSITNFIPDQQCLPSAFPQMYHLFPGVARVITSFPLIIASFSGGTLHCSKAEPLTLKTL